jgi:hypothetical protein
MSGSRSISCKDDILAKKFVFRSLDTIGYPDALEDDEFLKNCFVDSGYLEILRNTQRPERIVLGRTGAGKSALLERLFLEEGEEHVRRFLPEKLALNYVSNSTILTTLAEYGVNFDLFFTLLWRHVFAVEIIRWRFNISDEVTQRTAFQNLVSRFKPDERRAFDYLQQFGNKFWIESDDRVLEFTKKFEQDLKIKLSLPEVFGMKSSIASTNKSSEEEKREIRERAQKIVNELQVRCLAEIVSLIKSILQDEARKWYIIVDKLDENWVDDCFKSQLIRSLMDTVRSFREVENLKIIVALRYDLIDRIFAMARGSGAQREKYQGICLHVRWPKKDLQQLLDSRIYRLVRSRYSKSEKVSFKDLFPREIAKKPTLEWILDRTLMRPRDVITFVNMCIKNSDGQVQISSATMRATEGEYSKGRLDAIFSEWDIDYPNLRYFIDLLKRKQANFHVGDCTDDELLSFAEIQLTKFKASSVDKEDVLSRTLRKFEEKLDIDFLRRVIFFVFYRVGIISIKTSATNSYTSSFEGES